VIDGSAVAERLARIRDRIAGAGGKDVAIVAVTKALPAEAWRIAAAVGCTAVGENYAQEVLAKAAEVPRHLPVHFIGHIQTNKVRSIGGIVDVWQSVDRESVVREIVKRTPSDRTPRMFIQINATGEDQKSGCAPTDAATIVDFARHLGCRVEGAMTVGPTSGDPTATRQAFALLRRVADDLGLRERSMGMTNDLEIAIEEGSTMVRIGTALFGERP
jgi:pyridoxal phosphate enzyme (YggS family)